MSLATLGKRKHQILRDSGIEGEWVDGEYVPPVNKCVTIYANVQPSYGSPLLKHLPKGEREKENGQSKTNQISKIDVINDILEKQAIISEENKELTEE